MTFDKSIILRIIDRTNQEIFVSHNPVPFELTLKRVLAVLSATTAFWLLGKVIGFAGIATLGNDFYDIFAPLEFIGLTIGFLIGMESDIEDFFAAVSKIVYYTAIVLTTCSIGILLGLTIFSLS
ncbi:MAG: hypothetical protein KDJ65_18790 [Anaerolineae bacterium]|nr:hypothetical protein [Anaerolineae bacterium]